VTAAQAVATTTRGTVGFMSAGTVPRVHAPGRDIGAARRSS
jgi:hypothetical protein